MSLKKDQVKKYFNFKNAKIKLILNTYYNQVQSRIINKY